MDYARSRYKDLSLRQACRIFNISSSVYCYHPLKRADDSAVYDRLVGMAEKWPTWGFWKLNHRLRLEGSKLNHKRVYRLYKEARLHLRRRTRKRVPARIKQPLLQPLVPNLNWSMDFMRDMFWIGKPFRTFNVIDDFNREALNITVSKSITSERVVKELTELTQWRGLPSTIRVDNGPEFIAQALKEWCEHPSRNIELIFIEKGKPSQNGYIERLNKTFREDILDSYQFEEVSQAQAFAYEWMWMYNNERPHESLNNLPPTHFLLKYGKLHPHPRGYTEFPTFQQDINTDNILYI